MFFNKKEKSMYESGIIADDPKELRKIIDSYEKTYSTTVGNFFATNHQRNYIIAHANTMIELQKKLKGIKPVKLFHQQNGSITAIPW